MDKFVGRREPSTDDRTMHAFETWLMPGRRAKPTKQPPPSVDWGRLVGTGKGSGGGGMRRAMWWLVLLLATRQSAAHGTGGSGEEMCRGHGGAAGLGMTVWLNATTRSPPQEKDHAEGQGSYMAVAPASRCDRHWRKEDRSTSNGTMDINKGDNQGRKRMEDERTGANEGGRGGGAERAVGTGSMTGERAVSGSLGGQGREGGSGWERGEDQVGDDTLQRTGGGEAMMIGIPNLQR